MSVPTKLRYAKYKAARQSRVSEEMKLRTKSKRKRPYVIEYQAPRWGGAPDVWCVWGKYRTHRERDFALYNLTRKYASISLTFRARPQEEKAP